MCIRDRDFENFYFFSFFGPQISGFPGPQISKFPDFQVPRFPDAAAADSAADGRTLRSQPDPSPNAPRDQIRRKGPCCDNTFNFKLSRAVQKDEHHDKGESSVTRFNSDLKADSLLES